MFKDRKDAGRKLAEELLAFRNEDLVVLAIPRGGLPLGAIIAKRLKAPLEVALSKKIGHPYNKEYAIGAVSLDHIILTDAMGVTKGYITEETESIRQKLKERQQHYFKNRPPKSLKNKIVLIVDDGIATGNTILVTVALVLQQNPKRIIVAVPVGSAFAVQTVKKSEGVDEVICLEIPYDFKAVSQLYEEFQQVSDKEAISLFQRSNLIK